LSSIGSECWRYNNKVQTCWSGLKQVERAESRKALSRQDQDLHCYQRLPADL